ncbi:MAG: hypothetical protein IJL39_05160 [Clostridia bacterium]|nr:hypothetical protein [Clostridia bacterium]
MSTGYSSKTWCCPFFRYDKKREVRCEAGAASFATKETFERYTDTYCASVNGWRDCTLAAALVREYDEMEEEDNGQR